MNNNTIVEGSVLGSKYFNPEYLFNKVIELAQDFYNLITASGTRDLLHISNIVLFFLSIFFVAIIVYSAIRVLEIRKKEHKHLQHEIEEYAHHQREREKKMQEGEAVSRNPAWLRTLNYLFSQHSSDWKLSIIEADSMLEALMDQLGFKGENLGERLKNADKDKFKSLSSAWEVHAIRNKIAHEGSSFELSQHEAKRVIAIYEQIFRQYGYI